MPAAALKLIHQIDEGEVSAKALEQTICSDPALAINFIRLSSIYEDSTKPGGWPVRSTIMLLGQKSVRRIAVSLLALNSLSALDSSCLFDRAACARHSMFVAQLAQKLLIKKYKIGNQFNEHVAEAYAMGILHELPLCFLAKIAPAAYNRIYLYAQRHTTTLGRSFEALYEHSISELGVIGMKSWGIPPEYGEIFRCADEPWLADVNFDVIAAVVYADYLSYGTDYKIERWPLEIRAPLEVQECFDFQPEDLESVQINIPKLELAA